jgi:hypothetical protein
MGGTRRMQKVGVGLKCETVEKTLNLDGSRRSVRIEIYEA